MRMLRNTALVCGGLLLAGGALAQTLPLEVRQDATLYNLQSTNGMPISHLKDNPPGSDGRAPGPNPGPIGTPNQFQSLIVFGGLATPRNANHILIPGKSYAANSAEANLDLPRGTSNNTVVLVMTSARVGSPFMSRSVTFLFGEIIPVPNTDETGKLLSSLVPPQRPEDYWVTQPYTTNDHANAGYYWSAPAGSVFAIQPGPVDITWKKSVPAQTRPADFDTSPGKYVNEGGNYYTLYPVRYIISGSAVKPPRRMYWTEKQFQATGKAVDVPTARVGAVNIIYNNSFPRTNETEYVGPGYSSPTDGTTNQALPTLRTLWYELGQIKAYNREGRVFLELLGDFREDGTTRHHLGFEIVDVIQQPNPSDVTIELGEQLTAYPGGTPDDSDLYPDPIPQTGASFIFRHNVNGSDRLELFAIRETQNLNDLQVHWLERGLEGLKWPFLFVRYKLVWPDDVNMYSHYARPLVNSEEEAMATAVKLPTENAPIIDYQDPFDQPRAKLTERFEFYSYLVPEYPAHRTLLRFTSGEYVAFERVFSWLVENLKTTNFLDSVATNLSTWDTNLNGFQWPPESGCASDSELRRSLSATASRRLAGSSAPVRARITWPVTFCRPKEIPSIPTPILIRLFPDSSPPMRAPSFRSTPFLEPTASRYGGFG